MGFRSMLGELGAFIKNQEQSRLQERAYQAVRKSGSRLLSERARGLREAAKVFERLDFKSDLALWALFGVDSQDDFRFANDHWPDGLASALAEGVSRQGASAMDALIVRLEKVAALAAAQPNRWGGEGAAEALVELKKMRPETERREIEEAAGPRVKASGSRRL